MYTLPAGVVASDAGMVMPRVAVTTPVGKVKVAPYNWSV